VHVHHRNLKTTYVEGECLYACRMIRSAKNSWY
jgi:hypothetical protein